MPTFQATEKARQRAKQIREVNAEFRRERLLERIAEEEFRTLAQLDILQTYGLKAFRAEAEKEVRRLVRRESQLGRAA